MGYSKTHSQGGRGTLEKEGGSIACHPSAREAETGRSLEFVDQASPITKVQILLRNLVTKSKLDSRQLLGTDK